MWNYVKLITREIYSFKPITITIELPHFKMNAMVDMPDDLDDNAGLTMKMIFAEEVKTYVKRNHTLKSNLATVYAVIWGQCSDDMKAKAKAYEKQGSLFYNHF